ncbi:unnamed protein product [Rhizoctonia solani]|uniref:Laminin domain protein n=1 Tax=Rhizoctonia solani TaxID=456999 RepID=A0A8H3HUF2_9AGAM|nr:unnamed protein product [Rhizoctonia solani]
MQDPGLLMGLADHLFGAQMARYRSKHSLITFPSDAIYTPPELPTHISVKLQSVSGAPSNDEMIKAQEALRSYQQFSHAPAMFDARVNMELSQHLFDLQMARYMRLAGEHPPGPAPPATARTETLIPVVGRSLNTTEQPIDGTNNAGTGAGTLATHQAPPPAPGPDVREFMDRSNQLAERFNQLLERSNELMERCNQPTHQPNSQTIDERFGQVLERLTQVEHSHRPTEQSDRLTERFNQFFERFNQLVEQASLPAQRANELAERSNELSDRANQLAGQLNQLSGHSNTLSEQANKAQEQFGNVLGNINKVLVRIQHAIVRNHKGNTITAMDCLVNEKGDTHVTSGSIPQEFQVWRSASHMSAWKVPVSIDGVDHSAYVPETFLGSFLRLYGLDGGVPRGGKTKEEKGSDARRLLGQYLSSCLG